MQDVSGTCVSENSVFAVGINESMTANGGTDFTGLLGTLSDDGTWKVNVLPKPLTPGSCVALSDKELLVGDNNGYIGYTRNGGASFDKITPTPDGCFVQRMVQTGPSLVMAFGSCTNSIGEPEMAVWQSTDGGESWKKRPWSFTNHGFSFDDAAKCSDVLSVAIDGDGYYYISGDEGQTWNQSMSGLTPQQGQALTCLTLGDGAADADATAEGFIYQMGTAGGFMRSLDGGKTTHFLSTLPDDMYAQAMVQAVDPRRGGALVLWSSTSSDTQGGLHLYSSPDNGNTWKKILVKKS